MPTNIANKNIKVIGSNKAIEDTAGPGHKPTKPQPMPNKEEPIISFLSKSIFCGDATKFLRKKAKKSYTRLPKQYFLNLQVG